MARRVRVAAGIVVATGVLFGSAGSASSAASSAVPGSRIWVARYNGPGKGPEVFFPRGTHSVAVSPKGNTVFVTGGSTGAKSGLDYATVAYNAATGARLWVARYNGPANKEDVATSVAVSPNGTRVFVTGSSTGATSGADIATVAYNASTGAQLWVARYNGPANKNEGGISLAVGAGGKRVFVAGTSEGRTLGHEDYVTLAYDAATGAQLWARRYNGPANGDDNATSLAVDRNGARVFVTGYSAGTAPGSAYATVAYNAATGVRLWVQRYGAASGSHEEAWSVAVSPNGAEVFVTGTSFTTGTGATAGSQPEYATVAYNAATGARRWARRYTSARGRPNFTESLAVSPDGAKVFVTGTTATLAYRATTGAQLWARPESAFVGATGGSTPPPVAAASPNGSRVFVAGSSRAKTGEEFAAVAYNAATGALLWTSRYGGSANGGGAQSVVVSPNGSTVFVNGIGGGVGSGADYVTIAYRA